MHKTTPIFEQLPGEEQPRSIATLLFLLVSLLHVWGVLQFVQSREPLVLAQPLMMQVSMVSAPSALPQLAPPAAPKPPPPVKPKQKPKPKQPPVKKPPKPTVKKPKPKPTPKAVTATVPVLQEPADEESLADASENQNDARPSPPSPSNSKPQPETYSEASFNANYGTNPKPKYPAAARSRGWQGQVLLRVKVTAEGYSESVTVERSSGHDLLDEAAVTAVEKWRFIPARRGTTAVACTVRVPIIFTLNN